MTDESTDKFADDLLAEDELGVVVRGHLYVERAIDHLLGALLEHPAYLEPMNLSYANKVHLACAAGLSPKFRPMLLALGRIRNNFSHNLDVHIDESTVKNLHSVLDDQTRNLVPKIFGCISVDKDVSAFKNMHPRDQFTALILSLRVILNNALSEVEAIKNNGRTEISG